MDDYDYPYEQDPASRRPGTLADWEARQRAKLAAESAAYYGDLDPDAPDPRDIERIAAKNARIERAVESFATLWLEYDPYIIDNLVIEAAQSGAFSYGPGIRRNG